MESGMDSVNVTLASALEGIFYNAAGISANTTPTLTTGICTMTSDTSLTSLLAITPSPRLPRSMRSRSNSNTSRSGRRRFISRDEAVDVPEPEVPVEYHSPQVSKVYPPTATNTAPTTSRLVKSATIDYAPTSSGSHGVKDTQRSRARAGSAETVTASRSSTAFRRSNTLESDLRWGQKEATSAVDRGLSPTASRSGVYPQTYPGGRLIQEKDRSLELNDGGAASKLVSPRSVSRRSDTSPHSIEELPEPVMAPTSRGSRSIRGSSAECQSSQVSIESSSKGSVIGRRQEKRARALAMEAAQQGPRHPVPATHEHVAPVSLKPPDSPLVQHAPRKAQPFLGRSQTIDLGSISPTPSAELVPPSPVPPWRSKTSKDKSKTEKSKTEKSKTEKSEKEKQKAGQKPHVLEQVWEGLRSPKSPEKGSKGSSQRVLSPTAMLVASSTRLMSPIAAPPTDDLSVKSPSTSKPSASPPSQTSPSSTVDEAQARAERISLYKEQRRKELTTLYSSQGQDGTGKNNSDANLENFMKHAKKYGLDKSPDSGSTEQRTRAQMAPLVATVAPMVTSTITSPITSTVTSPLAPSDSKGSAIVTLSKSSATKPSLTSPTRFTSPSTLTATRVVPTQSLVSLSPTKPIAPSPSHATRKITSPPSSKKQLDHDERTSSKQIKSPTSLQLQVSAKLPKAVSPTSTHEDTLSMNLGSQSTTKVISPQKARLAFFAEMNELDKDPSFLDACHALTPKVTKSPLSSPVPSPTSVTAQTPGVTSPTVATKSKISPKSLPAPITSPKSMRLTQTQQMAPPKSLTSPITSPKSMRLSQTVISPLMSPKPLSSPVISPKSVTSSKPVTLDMTSPITSPKSITSPKQVSLPLTQPKSMPSLKQDTVTSPKSATYPAIVLSPKSANKFPKAPTVLSPGSQLPITVKIKQDDTNTRKPAESISQTSKKLTNESRTKAAHIPETTKSHDATRVLAEAKQERLVEDVSVATSKLTSALTSQLSPEFDVYSQHPAAFSTADPLMESIKQLTVSEKSDICDRSDQLTRTFSKVQAETSQSEMSPIVPEYTPPAAAERPIKLHIEKPLIPVVILKPKLPALAQPEELDMDIDDNIPATVDEPLADIVSPVLEVDLDELEAEVRLMEQILFSENPIEPALASPETNSISDGHVDIKSPIESSPKVVSTTPVSHADLYEQAIANRKIAAEEQIARREEEAAASVESERARRMAEVHELESRTDSQTLSTHTPGIHDQIPQAAALVEAPLPSVPVTQTQLSPVQLSQEQPPDSHVPRAELTQIKMPQVQPPQVQLSPELPKAQLPKSEISQPLQPEAQLPEAKLPEAPPPKTSAVDFVATDSKKIRVKELQRADSFNRADSPIREPMPLPKDSVIVRHRQSKSRHRVRSHSSSSESGTSPVRSPTSSPRSPRSPRSARKAKGGFTGGRDSTRLGVNFVAEDPERGRCGRPERYNADGTTSTSRHQRVLAAGSAADQPDPTMGQNTTKPSPPSGESTTLAFPDPSGDVNETSSLASSRHGSDAGPLPLNQQTTQQQAPGSLAASDSSTSTRRDRKRFKKRAVDDASSLVEVKVRPGKKDKSSSRKSALNITIDEEAFDTRRTSDARRSSAASDDVLERPQARLATSQRDAPLAASEIRLASPEVLKALTSQQGEVLPLTDCVDGIQTVARQGITHHSQITSKYSPDESSNQNQKQKSVAQSNILSPREINFDQTSYMAPDLQTKTNFDQNEIKSPFSPKMTEPDLKTTPTSSVISREYTSPTSPTHQNSTFIMLTTANAKSTSGVDASKPEHFDGTTSKPSKDDTDLTKPPLKAILRKAKTVDASGVWDAELENVLKQRREKEDSEETNEESKSDRPVTPTDGDDSQQQEPKMSIAERIFKMESMIEENKFSKSYAGSGATTPRVMKLRMAISGPSSPTLRAAEPLTPEDLDDNDTLMSKLADVAVVRDAAARRRSRKDEGVQSPTSAIKENEKLDADLRDISETATICNEPTPTMSRKKLVRKKVEAARAVFCEDSDSDFDKLVEMNKRRAQSMTSPDVPVEDVKEEVQDDLSKMSVSQKMALFRKLEDEEKDKRKGGSGGSKRFADRRNKRMERSRTQPITEEEIGKAAVIAKEQKEEQAKQAQVAEEREASIDKGVPLATVSLENLNGTNGNSQVDESTTEDDLSKLSLMDKMKLFSQQDDEINTSSALKRDTPVTRRKQRRLQSRFKTQPVTTEEVTKATQHRISPLALSLVKPPDPDVLGTMSLKDQKDFMAKWAMETLKQLGTKTTPTPGSRPTSRGPVSDEEETEGQLGTSKEQAASVRGILKPEQKAELERELRGILRAAGAPYPLESTLNASQRPAEPIHGILKKEVTPSHDSQPVPGILKHDSAFEQKVPAPSALKKDASESIVIRAAPERSAMKKETLKSPVYEPEKPTIRMDYGEKVASSTDDITKGILRKEPSNLISPEVKSALKVIEPGSEPQIEAVKRGILKTRSTDTAPVQAGILRSPPQTTTTQVTEYTRTADREVVSPRSSQGEGQNSLEESESSGGSSRPIKNEAVARRRNHRIMRKQGDRYHTQPVESNAENGAELPTEPKRAGLQRHHTQPITSEERQEAETGKPKTKDGTIASRLALLQRSGEEDWKKRVLRKEKTVDTGEVVKMREKKGDRAERPTSIADRLTQLQGSQDSWRDRIEEQDVKQFTVAGRLELQGKATTPDSPLLARRRKPKVPLARDSESSEAGSTPTSPTKSVPPHPITSTPKGVLDTACGIDSLQLDLQALSTPIMHVEETTEESDKNSTEGPETVDVPHASEGVDKFFEARTAEELLRDKHEVSVDDLDHIFLASQDILPSVQKARPQTRRAASSKNPLKTLAQRRDLQSQYIQVRSGIADREMRRIKREQISGSACFATEALAGLAATENFASVMLRKTDSLTTGTPGNQQLEPYRKVMLLQVKGRRHCQTRLVAPDASSLNSGDCFILVTPERVWVWVGDFCNVIEKAKAVEVAGVIQAKRDLGCKAVSEPTVMEENAASVMTRFWDVLGGEADYQDVGPAEEDEVYEADMAETIRVYRLLHEEFVLWEEVSECVPRFEMLSSKDILIFDFGSEFYLWTGKQAAFPKRKLALKLARNLWADGYDYTGHGFNPMSPLTSEKEGGLPLKDTERPEWTLFGKVNQNMETILFREKFFDWPDASRLILVKAADDVEAKGDGYVELAAYDVTKMLPIDLTPVSMVLEGSNVGRGNTWTELYEGLRREYEISTLATKVWHVNEYQVLNIDDISYGQFHDGDTYVVRWQYMIMQTGMKTLKGASARHSLVGRERCAYYFWQGRHSSVNEKGASALMTVELDEERGPQVRVLQDKEPPCFLNLFKSKMVVHIGKREAEESCTQGKWRLYVVRNELSGEAHLTEVSCMMASLRSRAVFVLLHITTGQMLLWNGAKSGINTRQRALEIAQNLKSSCPAEMGVAEGTKIVMTKIDEGCETAGFWEAMGSHDTNDYVSLLDDVRPWTYTPRLFLMSSVSGEFRATEVLNPCRSGETVTAFPFLQADLYAQPQPAQLMIDNNHEVLLWQGWWPEGTEEEENVVTGSAVARFNTDRCCALQTVLNYCQAKGSGSPAFVVYAGLEPKAFTNLFPYWEHNAEAQAANLKEGKKANQRLPVKDVLKQLTSTRYTYDKLQERPLPDGVDPLRIEAYLHDDEFQRVLGMTREEFYERPAWKQADLKKEFSLF